MGSPVTQPITQATSASLAKSRIRLKIWQPPPDIWVPLPWVTVMPCTAPSSPESMISLAFQYCGKLRSRSPQANLTPRSRQTSTMRSASARLAAMGFSQPMA